MMSSAAFCALFSLLLMAGLDHEVACQGGMRGSVSDAKEQILNSLQFHGSALVPPDSNEGPSSALVVNISLTLTHIAEMDKEGGGLKAMGYLALSWTDGRLRQPRFIPSVDIASVSIEASSIWTPDIELYNTDTPSMQNLNRKDLALVLPEGQVAWVPQLTLTTFCRRLPHQQPPLLSFNCTLSFGSWVQPVEEMDLRVAEQLDLSQFVPHPHWRLQSPSARRVQRQFACCRGTYAMADFSFRLDQQ